MYVARRPAVIKVAETCIELGYVFLDWVRPSTVSVTKVPITYSIK